MEQRASAEPGGLPEDESVAQTIAEDPLLRYLKDNWKPFATVVGVALAIFWSYSMFEETREARLRDASDLFFGVQEEYESLAQTRRDLKALQERLAAAEVEEAEGESDKEGAEKAEPLKSAGLKKEIATLEEKRQASITKLGHSLEALSDARGPYAQFAPLYRALVREAPEEKLNILNGLGWESKERAGDNAARFAAELGALHAARVMLDVPDKKSEGVKRLEDLAERGYFVNVAAAVSYTQLAKTPEQKERALTILTSIADKEPEQMEFIENALSRLR